MTLLAILDRFIRRGDRGKARETSVPSGLRVYAIGDIHGRAGLLRRLHDKIEQDAAGAPSTTAKKLVYLGDYVDRGLDSRGVIDLILGAPMDGFEKICLKGNHEDALLQFLDDASVGPNWFAIGGGATAVSYGVQVPQGLSSVERFEHLRSDLLARIPREHLKFLYNLDLMYRAGDYIFVHAGIRPGRPIDQQTPGDVMWIRDEFLKSKRDHGATIVHGHSPKRRPDIQTHRIGIDTGAFATNILTCLVLEGTKKRFLSTGSE